jgi:hypothetical protein
VIELVRHISTCIVQREEKYEKKTAGWALADHNSNTAIVKELNITQLFGQNTEIQ